MTPVHLRLRGSLLLVFLLALLAILLSNEADARAKNSMKLRIPYLQRANCLAKLLCGIQAQSNSKSGAALYANQAHLLRKYFQTYELPELDDKPLKSKSSAADDDDDLDDSTSSDESNESTVEEVVKKPTTTAAPAKKQEKAKSKPDRKSSLFDTGVPIIEKPTVSPAVAIQQQKGKRHWTPINQELTVREAREMASKSVKDCSAIEGCGFTFKQIFVSLQEDSNVMGSEAITALSSADSEAPFAEPPKEEKEVKVQLFIKKATVRPTTLAVEAVDPDDELEPLIMPVPVGTSPYPPPPIIINENEDEVENEDVKIVDVEDLFLSTDHVLSTGHPLPARKKTRRPVTANTKKEKLRPTTARPEVVAYEYQVTSSRTKGSKTRAPPRLNYKTATAPKPQGKKNYPTTTTTERTTTTTAPSTQMPIFEPAKIKKKPTRRPTKHEFQQDEENYDHSRDTYDEEEELENPSANDYGDDLEDVSLEEDDDTEAVEDDEDDEAVEQHQGGWNEGGGEKKKKPKPPKQKKKKNKKKKKKNKKKNKNKNYKKKGHQEQQGWGWPPKRQQLTEIGGRPLSPPPEPHPGDKVFSQSSGWATLYRREPEQAAGKEAQKQQHAQPPAPLLPSFRFGVPSLIASNSTSSNSSYSTSARLEAEEEHQEYKYRPQADQTPPEKVTGFSITKLVSPFTSLVKVLNSNMRGGR